MGSAAIDIEREKKRKINVCRAKKKHFTIVVLSVAHMVVNSCWRHHCCL